MSITGVETNSVLNDLSFSNQPESEKSEAQSDKDMQISDYQRNSVIK